MIVLHLRNIQHIPLVIQKFQTLFVSGIIREDIKQVFPNVWSYVVFHSLHGVLGTCGRNFDPEVDVPPRRHTLLHNPPSPPNGPWGHTKTPIALPTEDGMYDDGFDQPKNSNNFVSK